MLTLTRVTKSYLSGRRKVAALRNISFTVREERFISLIGKSGSGKTTLLHCAGGLETVDEGSILCCGVNVCELRGRRLSMFHRRQLGFIFQQGNLISYLSAAQNIAFPLTLNGYTPRKRAGRVEELLDRIGLQEAGDALPHELSAGEIQRVAVARAIAHLPKLLLADEPTANLDTSTGQTIVGLMDDLARTCGCTVVMATHDTDITGRAEKIIHLKDGKIHGA